MPKIKNLKVQFSNDVLRDKYDMDDSQIEHYWINREKSKNMKAEMYLYGIASLGAISLTLREMAIENSSVEWVPVAGAFMFGYFLMNCYYGSNSCLEPEEIEATKLLNQEYKKYKKLNKKR